MPQKRLSRYEFKLPPTLRRKVAAFLGIKNADDVPLIVEAEAAALLKRELQRRAVVNKVCSLFSSH